MYCAICHWDNESIAKVDCISCVYMMLQYLLREYNKELELIMREQMLIGFAIHTCNILCTKYFFFFFHLYIFFCTRVHKAARHIHLTFFLILSRVCKVMMRKNLLAARDTNT